MIRDDIKLLGPSRDNSRLSSIIKETKKVACSTTSGSMWLVDAIDYLSYEQATLAKIGMALTYNPVGFKKVRSWDEFFGKFRPPDHLQKRIISNLEYYKFNYVTAAIFIQCIFRPFLILAFIAQYAAIFMMMGSRTLCICHIILWISIILSFNLQGLIISVICILIHAAFKTRQSSRVIKEMVK
eukprot:GHVL01024180.1.p1 GENE.GHVL01024180.1~~GHVL01024180.1.p1  ORF type:complete len:184 (+),score=25.81 GHVL01024180.1:50-601(+)